MFLDNLELVRFYEINFNTTVVPWLLGEEKNILRVSLNDVIIFKDNCSDKACR